MKHIILILLVSSVVVACQQKERPVTKQSIAGTRVSLQPPKGFLADASIGGFRHATEQATIMVMSIPLPYEEAARELSADRIKSLGQKLLSKEEVVVDHVKGVLCKINFQSMGMNFNQWKLVVPEETHTLTVNGTYLSSQDQQLSNTIREAVISSNFNKEWKPDLKSFTFEISPGSSLKLAKVLEGPSIVFTKDGLWTHQSIFSLSLLCASTTADTTLMKEDYAVESFLQLCPACSIEKQDTVRIDGLKGIEMWGTRKDSSQTRLKYEMLIFEGATCYIIVGTADHSDEETLQTFRSAARTWRKKIENKSGAYRG
jgi:hypothetical protein